MQMVQSWGQAGTEWRDHYSHLAWEARAAHSGSRRTSELRWAVIALHQESPQTRDLNTVLHNRNSCNHSWSWYTLTWAHQQNCNLPKGPDDALPLQRLVGDTNFADRPTDKLYLS